MAGSVHGRGRFVQDGAAHALNTPFTVASRPPGPVRPVIAGRAGHRAATWYAPAKRPLNEHGFSGNGRVPANMLTRS
ncbi:hypothetical protein GCM10010273_59220 [Streptomyces lavendulocolor]